jgi:pimeloyl-ACP methyl ester carboxylesterase
MTAADAIGARAMLVHAIDEDAVAFYRKFGFEPSPLDPKQLMLLIPERPLSIEQYAKDVVGLLKFLGISKADFFGESYGGNAAAMIANSLPRACRSCGDLRSNLWPSSDCLKPSDNAL